MLSRSSGGGGTEDAEEALPILKTRLDKLRRLIEFVKGIHSYEAPEIIATPTIAGYDEYLK